MSILRPSTLHVLAALALAATACSALSPTPVVTNIRMATDELGASTTSSYSPGDSFFVFADLSGLSSGSVVEAKWFAVNADGMDPSLPISTSDYVFKPGIDYVHFQLNTTGNDWPAGSYRVELYLNGTKVGEQAFTVQ